MGKVSTKITVVCILVIIISMIGCGFNSVAATRQAATPTNISQKIASDRTPESGIAQKLYVPADGHYESIVVAHGTTFVGADNGIVYALAASNGSVRWHYDDIGSRIDVYGVSNGVLYAVAGTNYDTIYALNADSGKLLWHHQVDSGIFGLVATSAAIYANTNGTGNQGASVYALRNSDGAMLWRYTARIDLPQPLMVSNGVVYIRLMDMQASGSYLAALRGSDGHLLWQNPIDQPADVPPVEINGIVYLGTSSGAVYAFHVDTGKQVWRFAGDGNAVIGSPTVVNGIIYINAQQEVYALRASDGVRLWKEPTGNSGSNVSPGGAVVSNGMVFAATDEGMLYAFRVSNGALLWQYRGSGVFGPIAVRDGVVYANTQGETNYGLRTTDGTLLWQGSIKSYSTWSDQAPPYMVGDDVAYSGTEDGVVSAIRGSDGAVLWQFRIKERPILSDGVYHAIVTFDASVSYVQALRTITDLGLATSAIDPCRSMAGRPWIAEDWQQNFAQEHSLRVDATTSSAPLWLGRLQTTSGVVSAKSLPGVINCPAMRPATPTTGVPTFLPEDKIGVYVRVTFASGMQDYDTALAGVNILGFSLDNPCYEQARAHGEKPTWHPMGQEKTFQQNHTLILVTTGINSTQWQEQLQKVNGVVRVEAPFTAHC